MLSPGAQPWVPGPPHNTIGAGNPTGSQQLQEILTQQQEALQLMVRRVPSTAGKGCSVVGFARSTIMRSKTDSTLLCTFVVLIGNQASQLHTTDAVKTKKRNSRLSKLKE